MHYFQTTFVILLEELKAAFQQHGLMLTAAVSAGKETINKAYNVIAMSEHLDLINVMAYDFHGAWEQKTHHNSPLFAHPADKENNNDYLNVVINIFLIFYNDCKNTNVIRL